MKSLRDYVTRARALGWPLLVTTLAFFLALVALTQPLWMLQRTTGAGDVDRTTYGWTAVVEDEFRDGAWAGTTVTPYSSPTFGDFRMREAVTTTYLIGGIATGWLFLLVLVRYMPQTRRLPEVAVFAGNLIGLILAAAALVYPVLTVPGAAAAEVNSLVAGWSGTAQGTGNSVWAWGAGAAWWLWAVSGVLMAGVVVLPILQKKVFARPRSVASPRPGRR